MIRFAPLAALAVACTPKAPVPEGPMPIEVPDPVVEPFVGGLQVHTFTLPNGLTLKVVPDDSAPVVAYHTWMGVGSADELDGQTGMAHLFEHLMFKGTDGYADGEYMARVDAMGAAGLNAWTWVDETVYVQTVPSKFFPDLAALEATRFDGLVLDAETFEKEREVVINERRLRVDNDVAGTLEELLWGAAYEVHPYAWSTLGSRADLDAMTVEATKAFYDQWYAPNNATIIAVGDVDPKAAYEVVFDNYGHMEPSDTEAGARVEEPEQTEQRRAEATFATGSDLIGVAFKVPEYVHEDIPALLVLDAALTSGQTGRLKRALRDGGYASEVTSGVMPLRDPSLMTLTIKARPGVPASKVEKALWTELARIREDGISPGELAMGKAQWQLFQWGEMEEASGKAQFLGFSTVFTGDHLDGLRIFDGIEAVTAEDVQRVAKKYLVSKRSTVAVVAAEEPAEEREISGGTFEPSARVEIEARAAADAPTELPESTEVRGATVLYEHDATVPIVHFRIRFPSGSAADPEGKGGLANLTAKLLFRGTKQRSRAELESALEQLGASLSVDVDADAILISGESLSASFPAVMALVTEAISTPALDAGELDQLREEVVNDLAGLRDDDSTLATTAALRAVYGADHPYGRDARGTVTSLEAITHKDVVGFHGRSLKSEGVIIGIAGAFDAETPSDVDALLKQIEGAPAEVGAIPAPAWPEGRTVVLVDKPDRTQVQVRMVRLGLDQTRDDFPAWLLANDAFGIGFTGRLMQEVRVKRGWSYFAYSWPTLHEAHTSWTIGLAPGTDYAADAVSLVLDLVAQADDGGFTPEELEQVRSSRLNGAPFLVDTPAERLDHRIRTLAMGYDRLAATKAMKDVHLEVLNKSFSSAVAADRMVIAIVCTADEMKPVFEEALGEVTVVPYDSL